MAKHSWSIKEMDLTSLRLFAASVEEGTLARAAEREHIAVSAISRRISDLEWRCGVPLLERHERGVVPTAAGQVLMRQVCDLFSLLQRMVRDMEAIRGGIRGHIRLHAHMTATSGVLAERIASFLAMHPEIEVEISEFTSAEVVHAVRTGTADLGLISGTVDGGDLHVIPWEKDELVAIMPAGHPLGAKERLKFADLLGEPFVGMQYDSALQSLYRDLARAQNRTLKERIHATSFESVRKMVSAGLGVAILPATAAHPYVEDLGLILRPLDEPWVQRSLMLCLRDPAQLLAATRLLVDHLTPDRS